MSRKKRKHYHAPSVCTVFINLLIAKEFILDHKKHESSDLCDHVVAIIIMNVGVG